MLVAIPNSQRVLAATPVQVTQAALLMLLLLLLQACGGSGDAVPAPQGPAAPQALAVSQPGELTSFMQGALRKRLAAAPSTVPFELALTGASSLVQTAPAAATAGGDAQARSGTLLQEAGVDEADLLLSKGQQLYTLQPDAGGALKLRVYRRDADGVAQGLQAFTLSSEGSAQTPKGLMFSEGGHTLVALSSRWDLLTLNDLCAAECSTLFRPPVAYRMGFEVRGFALASDGTATATERLHIEGRLLDSRRIGNRLYLISSHSPVTPLDFLPVTASPAEREAAITRTTAAQFLPRIRRHGGAAQPLLADTDCWVQKDNASSTVELTTITVVDLATPTLPATSRCFVGGAEALYMSTSQLYLATTRWVTTGPLGLRLAVLPNEIKTDIHKFALQGSTVDYRGSAAVEGHLGWDPEQMPLRMSEHNGDLRVLTFTGAFGWMSVNDASSGKTPSPARLTVLREASGTAGLTAVATLPNSTRPATLGKPNEQVYGVRFAGERAYVVTFRRTDPLYVLDLANATDPKVAGELELAGFSEHLFPLQGGLLLGVGRSADNAGRITGLQVALFNVQNMASPSLLATQSLGGPASQTALNASRHGLNFLQVGHIARVALPTLLVDANYVEWEAGLLRYEIDTTAGRLQALPMLGAARQLPGRQGVGWDRSLQIDTHIYYLNGGELRSFIW